MTPRSPLPLTALLVASCGVAAFGVVACSGTGSPGPGRGATPVAALPGPGGRTAAEPAPDPSSDTVPSASRPGVRIGRPSPAQRPGEGDLEEYDDVITEDAVTRRGLLITHEIDEELFFEIPDSLLGREMLLLARTTEGPLEGGMARGRTDLVVEWSRQEHRVVLREKLHDAMADSADAIWRQVSGMRRGPVLAALEVEAFGPDSAAVVEVTDLFTATNEALGSLSGVDRSRSWIERAWAGGRSVAVEATQTGREGRGGGSNGGSGSSTISSRIHWSMTLLPDDPMRPRLHDERVGFNSVRHVDYGRSARRAEPRRYIRRYSLEPSDTAAFLRGEPVEPVEPIVFWVDPATPDRLKPWVVEGVEAWNPAFEEAGFTRAIDARIAPSDDPGFALEDAWRSVIYWRPSRVENATGGQISDPRSGEILRGEVDMYHNIQNLLQQWYFTQVAPLDPRARTLPLPDSLMGRLVSYVVTHEVGHAIGFPHNMKASAMYPPDSIRSEDFLRRMNGHVATLMDYSRFNYVAQPEDSIPPELLVPGIGPYDRFAVRWGYRPILEADTPEEERPILDDWARAQDTIPWLRFTTEDASADPRALREAVGDADAVRSNTLGLKNLERVMDMLVPATERPGEDYELLEDLYGEAVDQWSRYMGHVAAAVGGADSRERYGRGPRFFPLDRKDQAEAVAFLRDRAFRTPEMLIRPEILRRIEAEGAIDRIRDAQARVLETLLSPSRLARLVEYEALAGPGYAAYTLAELMEDVRGGVWSELEGGAVRVDVYRRNLQRSYLAVVQDRLSPETGSRARLLGAPDPSRSDIRPVLRGELRRIREMARSARPRAEDAMTRLHLEDVELEIDRILDPKT